MNYYDDYDEFDDDDESPEIVMQMNEECELEIHKEPFATIEVKEEKDWNDLQKAIEIKKHIMDCHNCGCIGWSNCKYFRQNLDTHSTTLSRNEKQ